MRVTVSGKNLQVTDAAKAYAEKKLQRLTRYFPDLREAHVTHSAQRNWQIVEVQIEGDGVFLRGEERTPDVFTSIDAVVDKLERQIERFKGRLLQRHHTAGTEPATEEVEAAAPSEGEELPTIVRTKRFTIKPMSPEEAALQMELLGHDFFAFLNAETDQFNVLYRRRDGNYGLLEFE